VRDEWRRFSRPGRRAHNKGPDDRRAVGLDRTQQLRQMLDRAAGPGAGGRQTGGQQQAGAGNGPDPRKHLQFRRSLERAGVRPVLPRRAARPGPVAGATQGRSRNAARHPERIRDLRPLDPAVWHDPLLASASGRRSRTWNRWSLELRRMRTPPIRRRKRSAVRASTGSRGLLDAWRITTAASARTQKAVAVRRFYVGRMDTCGLRALARRAKLALAGTQPPPKPVSARVTRLPPHPLDMRRVSRITCDKCRTLVTNRLTRPSGKS